MSNEISGGPEGMRRLELSANGDQRRGDEIKGERAGGQMAVDVYTNEC